MHIRKQVCPQIHQRIARQAYSEALCVYLQYAESEIRKLALSLKYRT